MDLTDIAGQLFWKCLWTSPIVGLAVGLVLLAAGRLFRRVGWETLPFRYAAGSLGREAGALLTGIAVGGFFLAAVSEGSSSWQIIPLLLVLTFVARLPWTAVEFICLAGLPAGHSIFLLFLWLLTAAAVLLAAFTIIPFL